MPGMNAVLKAWHVMLGRDLHIPWPPGSPAPAPAPVPYVTTMMMMGVVPLTTRYTLTVYTDGLAPAMVRGTDIGPMIPHIGPPSVTLPIEMLTSGSKSHFGASSVQVKDQWGAPGNLACALLGFTNPNLNCGTPMPTPTGLVIAPTTHMETLTLGDMAAGLYLMACDFMVQTILNAVGGMIGEGLSKGAQAIASRLGAGLLSRTVARQLARAAGVRSNIGPAARALRAQAAARLAKIGERAGSVAVPIGLGIGSPLGISVSNVRDADGKQVLVSGSDRVTGEDGLNVEGNADAFGASVDNYFNSPAAEEVPPSSVTGAEGASGTAAPDAGAGGTSGTAPTGEAPSTSSLPDAGAASSSAPDASIPSASEQPNASMADQPNMSTPDGGGAAPTGSDGTPEAPFSSSDGDGSSGSGR